MVSERNRSSGDEPAAPTNGAAANPSAAFAEVAQRLSEARGYFRYYLRARLDQLQLSVRKLMILMALGTTALLVAAALAVTAVVLLCRGIAEGLTILFGGRAWLGDIVTAVLLLGGVGIAANIGIGSARVAWKQRVLRIYERRKHRQRQRHGTDVDERSQEYSVD